MKRCPSFDELSGAFSCAEPAAVVAHARTCLACARVWSDLGKMRAAARELPFRAPDGERARVLEEALVAAARAHPRSRTPRGRAAAIGVLLATAAAVGALSRPRTNVTEAPVIAAPAPPPVPAVTIRPAGEARFVRGEGFVRLESGVLELEVPAELRLVLATDDAELIASGAAFSAEAAAGTLAFVWVRAGTVELRLRGAAPRILHVGERWAPAPPPEPPAARPVRRRAAPVAADAGAPPEPTAEDWFQAGWTALGAGDHAAAAAAFEALLHHAPGDPLAEDAAYWHAIALLRGGGDAEAALQSFRARYPGSPRAPEVALFLGARRLQDGELDRAETWFLEAAQASSPELRARARAALEEIASRREGSRARGDQ